MENKDNILGYIPVQNCPWGTDEKNRVYLIKEKTRNGLLKKIIGWLGRGQDFHIHLDELGTAAWLQADGQRTILAIGSELKQAFAEKIEPAEARLARFFVMLARDGFVRWKNN
ncbi:MAG TPA: PqqD family peptide modification chaperone [Candidatus Binatia bacterium]|nr:PqqD family peptide modification chaperone [Candidatus Binatia bacterium]